MKKNKLLTAIISSSLLTTATHAADDTEEGYKELNPVIVTGQKIERTQMETVSSVLVFDEEMLSDTNRADNLYDVLDLAPNVTNAGGFNSLAIRGIANTGPTPINNGAGTIGIFIDNGLLTARSVQDNAVGTWDMESIEILRGPQSTTTGRNSLAGQIILNTKDPEFESNGAAKLAIGEDTTVQAAIAQTGPLTDNLAYRFAADVQHTDGFVTNEVFNDDDFNRSNTTNLRLKLLYQLENDGELLLTVNHNNFRENGDNAVDDSLSGRQSRLNYESEWETDSNNISLAFTQPINDNLTFEANTGFVRSNFWRTSDFDGTNDTPIVTDLITGQPIPTDSAILDQKTNEYNFNQEFLLHFKNDRIRSVAGVYFAKGELDDGYNGSNIHIQFPHPFYDPITMPVTAIELLVNNNVDPDEKFTTYALFGDIDYKLTNKFTIMAGLRANKETRESSVVTSTSRATTYGPLDATIDGLLTGSFSGSQKSERDSFVLLPKLGFNYMWSDSLATGFVVQKGYRPGGVSVNPIRGIAKDYDDETTINYEASLRASINNRLSINANLFYTDWKDQQVAVSEAGSLSPLDFLVENAGESHVYGFELEGSFLVNANWDIYGGIGYTQTKFDKFEANGIDFAGREFKFAKDWTASLASTYRFNNGWFANGTVSYSSEGAPDLTFAESALDSYTLVNIKVGYEEDNWGAYFYANNLFDDQYRVERVNAPAYGNAAYGDPRVIGLVLNTSW